jgi:hypothetical protein
MQSVEFLLLKYVTVLFLGVFIEGENSPVGAFLASRGYFNLAASFVALRKHAGRAVYYLAARMRGRPWFEQRFSNSGRYGESCVDGQLRQLGVAPEPVRFRFSHPSSSLQRSNISQFRFLALNLAAGILWAIPTAFLGFISARTSQHSSGTRTLHDGRHHRGVLLVLRISRSSIGGASGQRFNIEWSDLHGLFRSSWG